MEVKDRPPATKITKNSGSCCRFLLISSGSVSSGPSFPKFRSLPHRRAGGRAFRTILLRRMARTVGGGAFADEGADSAPRGARATCVCICRLNLYAYWKNNKYFRNFTVILFTRISFSTFVLFRGFPLQDGSTRDHGRDRIVSPHTTACGRKACASPFNGAVDVRGCCSAFPASWAGTTSP